LEKKNSVGSTTALRLYASSRSAREIASEGVVASPEELRSNLPASLEAFEARLEDDVKSIRFAAAATAAAATNAMFGSNNDTGLLRKRSRPSDSE
jgi:hypothetical protein